MKEIKEKPTKRVPRSNAAGKIPKAALKKAWTEAKEKSRTKLRESISTQGEGNYTTAQDTAAMLTDTSYSAIKQNTDFTVEQGRKLALKQIEKYRERRAAEQTETAQCQPETDRARHAARCRATSALWGSFAPPAGERKSRHRQDRATRYSWCDPRSAPTANRRN